MQLRVILSCLVCAIFGFSTILRAQGFGTLYGKVTDAVTGEVIPNAAIKFAGVSTTTNRFGQYLIRNLPATFQSDFTALNPRLGIFPLSITLLQTSRDGISGRVECTSANYFPYRNSEVKIIPCKRTELNISMTKEIVPGSLRFILTWKDRPADLDSYLFIPSINGAAPTFITYNRPGAIFVSPLAYLDRDARNGFGPETITIRQLFPGTYTYSIFNSSPGSLTNPSKRDGELYGSGAVVQIYNDKGLVQSITAPEQKSTTGNAQWWNVCTLDGKTGNITVINKITNQSTFSTITVAQKNDGVISSSLKKLDATLQGITTANFYWDLNGGRGFMPSSNYAPEIYATFDSLRTYDVTLETYKEMGQAKSSLTKPMYISNIMLIGSQDFHIYKNDFNFPSTLVGTQDEYNARIWTGGLIGQRQYWNDRVIYGTVADSISQLFIAIAVKDTNTRVTISLPDTVNGTIAPMTDMRLQSSQATLRVFPSSYGLKVAFGIYTPPPTLRNAEGLNEKIIPLSVQIGTAATQIMPIRLVRPPVVLVHDAGADPQSWQRTGFAAELQRRGQRLFYADDGGESVTSFSPKATIPSVGVAAVTRAIVEARAAMTEQGIACLRVDVVAHGTGGLFARSFLENESRLFSNQWGSVRRFITLGTPHGGSPVANYLWERRGLRTASDMTVADVAAQLGMPVGALQRSIGRSDTSISLLKQMPHTLSHAIVATWSDTAAQAYSLTNKLLRVVQTPEEYRRQGSFLASIFGQRPNSMLADAESQRSGLPADSRAVTEFPKTLHGDTPPVALSQGTQVQTLLSSPNVWKRVGDLLAVAESNDFVSGFPAPPSRWWTPAPSVSGTQPTAAGGIRIAQPTRGLTVTAGASTQIPVSIESFGDVQLQDVVVALESLPIRTVSATQTPITTTLSLAEALDNRIGRLRLTVTARDTRTGVLLTDTTSIIVQPQGELEDLQVQPCYLTMEAGKTSGTQQLRVTALYNGVWYDVSKAGQNTQYSIARAQASVNANGFVTALGSVSMDATPDTITVRYGGLTSKVPLTVSGVITATRGTENELPSILGRNESPLRLRISPQPAVQDMTIHYLLQSSAEVRLELLDMQGRIVASLERGWQGAGEQNISISTDGIASGMYMVRLLVGGSCCGQGIAPQMATVPVVVVK